MSDLIERLRKPSDSEETMNAWDGLRAYLLKGGRGSYARDIFEAILSHIDEEREDAADRITALEKENAELRAALEPFTQIVAARKSYVDATAVYNTRLELVREERGRGNWAMKLDREYAAMSEAQSTWHRTAQELADAALFKWAAIPRKPSDAEGREG